MNPRVKELAEQAGGVVLAGSEIEKFAELIVRECATHTLDLGRGDVGGALLEHFGVEE
jgi:hypothetical protein